MKLQLKRSNVLENGAAKQPTAEQLEYGELAINYNADDPTMFIKDNTNNVRVFPIRSEYPVIVGATPPNPTDYDEGTLWWNSDADSAQLFVLYDDPADGGGTDPGGLKWIEASPTVRPDEVGSQVIISDLAPDVAELDEGTMWWNSDSTDLQLYVLYNNNGAKEWIEASPNTGGGGAGDSASVSIAPTAPLAADSNEGDLWFNSNDGRLYIYYVDTTSSQWIDASPDSLSPDDFVEKAGDTMTGSLALNDKITLNATDGSASFANAIGPRNVITVNTLSDTIPDLPAFEACASQAQKDSGERSVVISSNGSAKFTGDLDVISRNLNLGAASGGAGQISFRRDSGQAQGFLGWDDGSNLVMRLSCNSGSGKLAFNTAGSEKMRIDENGRLLVGTSSSRNVLSSSSPGMLQVEVNGGGSYPATFTANRNDRFGPILGLCKSRGTTPLSQTIVQSDDTLGDIVFGGTDGSDEVAGASIAAKVDGTPGANNMPGRLEFSTTASGNSSQTERLRVGNDGRPYFYTSTGPLTVSNAAASNTTNRIFQGTFGASAVGTGTTSFYVTTNGDVSNSNNAYGAISDITLKENIVPASDQWDNIKDIEIVNYNFKEETGHQTHKQLGVIAQQVEEVSPGLVKTDEEGLKSVNYSVLNIKAIKALQEAMERIELLENGISKRDELISNLTKRVETLES